MKLLIGGSPCTHWSIAQTKNREIKPEGLGWELFLNYVIARDKFKPDYFLYENNKSMSREIREQITKELGVEPVLGSGSSRIAAYDMGLDFVGCEIGKTYYQLQEERFARHTAQTSLFVGG